MKEENGQDKNSRFRKVLVTAFWIVVIWWLGSAILPGLPTPLHAGKELLYVLKDMGDSLYYAVRSDDLEQSAQHIEHATPAVHKTGSQGDTLDAERRGRLPALTREEDSILRSRISKLSKEPFLGGRYTNILIIGIDSRLGVRDARADAIHLVTVSLDSGIVEIMSVPRDTYCDIGFPDTTTFNIVANARALGHKRFLEKVAGITHRGSIPYYVEVGFSQAMGVLEFLGYEQPVSTLQFLRTRKGLPGGDLQRAHNQALFMKENMVERFNLLTGAAGEVLLDAGLRLVSTNLTKDACLAMIYGLQKQGFPHHRGDAVRLRLLSPQRIRLREMPADSMTVALTLKKIRRRVGNDDNELAGLADRMRNIHRLARKDSTRPYQVIHRLERIYNQRAWIQIQDIDERIGIRDTLMQLLAEAYVKVGREDELAEMEKVKKADNIISRSKGK